MHDEINSEGSRIENDLVISELVSSADFLRDSHLPAENSDVDELRHWGFQYAIKNRSLMGNDCDQVLLAYRNRLAAELSQWETIYRNIQERFDKKIAVLQAEKDQPLNDAALSDPTFNDLNAQKDAILGQMTEIRKKIVETRSKMITGKDDMLNKWMEDAKKQMDMAIELQKQVFAETRNINAARYHDEKPTLDKQIEQWTIRRQGYQERQDEVHKRIKQLGADGVDPAAAYVFIGLGTSVAAAAGYFFSVFASGINFGNQDAFYFLLNGFLKAGGASDTSFLFKLFSLLTMVLGIGAISWVFYKVFNMHFGKKAASREDSFRISAGTRIIKDQYDSAGKLEASSWFSFWLQAGPAIIVIGVVLLILATNKSSPDEIYQVNSSVEGLLTGTAVALGIGGIMCIYIMKVVEPRLHRITQEEKGFRKWIKCNWELAACMTLFIVATISILFYPLSSNTSGSKYANWIAVSQFVSVAFLSAFPFAYGIRFRGLIKVSRFLQREIIRLDYAIAQCSSPEIPDVGVDYISVLKRMLENILGVVENKALLMRGMTSGILKNVSTEKADGVAYILKKLSSFFRWGRNNILNDSNPSFTINHLTNLAEWESKYFPAIDEEMKLLAFEYRELDSELKKIENQLNKLEGTEVLAKEEFKARQKKLQQHIELLLSYKEKADTARLNTVIKSNIHFIKAETAILDGYHLGIWYRENGMGPTANYYISSSFTPLLGTGDSQTGNNVPADSTHIDYGK